MEPPMSIDDIRELSRDATAEWVEPPKKAVQVGPSAPKELRAARMLSVSGMYLVETVDEPGTWWMGQESDEGVVRCWGHYGPLRNAIRGL
jgi:hypothetical protein